MPFCKKRDLGYRPPTCIISMHYDIVENGILALVLSPQWSAHNHPPFEGFTRGQKRGESTVNDP
jgi:hypothetical protein